MSLCRCGLAVRYCPDLGMYGHAEPLPRGRGHYVRLTPSSTSAPAVTGHGAEAGGSAERFPERGSSRSVPVKAG